MIDRIPIEEYQGKSLSEITELQKSFMEDLEKDVRENPGLVEDTITEIILQKKPGTLFWMSLTWALSYLGVGYLAFRKFLKIKISGLDDSLSFSIIRVGFYGAGLAVGLGLLVNLLGAALDFKPEAPKFQVALMAALKNNPQLLAWALYSVGLVTGIIEEWFFRGMLLKHYVLKGFERQGLVITSVIFGAMHMSGEASWIVPVLLTGVGYIFGSIYLRTNNIWAPICAHVVYNSFTLILAYFFGDASSI